MHAKTCCPIGVSPKRPKQVTQTSGDRCQTLTGNPGRGWPSCIIMSIHGNHVHHNRTLVVTEKSSWTLSMCTCEKTRLHLLFVERYLDNLAVSVNDRLFYLLHVINDLVKLHQLGRQLLNLKSTKVYINHHNHFMALFPGPPGWAGARRELLDIMVQGENNRGRHTDHPAGRHSIRTNQCPPPPSPHIFLQAGCPSCSPTKCQSTEGK